MNIVLDTNVFVSGIFFSGPPYKILKAWKNSRIQIVLTMFKPREFVDKHLKIIPTANLLLFGIRRGYHVVTRILLS